MAFNKISLALLTITASWALGAFQPILFHGTSVVLLPSNENSSPANSTVLAANFFCYLADEGYFSFGWWVPTHINGNTSHCKPDSDSFHWYEFAEKRSCNDEAGTCLYSTQNVPLRQPVDAKPAPFPERSLQYVIRPLNVGNGEYGQIAVSYIDEGELKVYGVGTRQILSGGAQTVEECGKAFRTLKGVLESHKPDLNFELIDPCVTSKLVKQDDAYGRDTEEL